ncbi:M64 family metallopeptidase [Nonomuraea muscovyensis]|uniref:IgA Peptidase M64 n=1 Tax=Nonomuraea muscovyensis TaxID=1124761 RepID=A0A7X0EVV7_9ACTN|nr:M64 family metallopeptidase [Nonomuraea muscovyensis]MBB6346307.1 hypothetical protein [Nonomuraea muscovyensis]MDF2713003.1 hypothetical protein [Nonomuraea muscovyensis]
MRHTPRLAAVVLVAAALLAAPGPAAAQPPPTEPVEWVEVFSPDGTIERVEVPERTEPRTARITAAPPTVVALQRTGPSDRRFDLVFVGDGYTAAELGAFRNHVAGKWAHMITVEPFRSYKDSFNVWMVNVVSPESGVDHDPYRGVSRDTALGMGFWCANMQRLLCVNERAARSYAAYAPEADQVIALANSTTYGGAGGGVATASGGNPQSGWIAVHELGHSVGGLGDEYDYPYDRYSGPEPSAPNISVYSSSQMSAYRLKWYAYLGRPTPDGGVIGTYAGAHQYRTGIHRPSQDSLMRTLGRPFNSVGLDIMIAAIRARTGT